MSVIRNYNKVILIGNVGSKPELRTTQTGIQVTDFPIAMTKQWKTQSGEEKSETTWVRIVCWNSLAENVSKIINTGDLVQVDGMLTNRARVKNEVQYTVTEVTANEVLLMSANTRSRTDVSEDEQSKDVEE